MKNFPGNGTVFRQVRGFAQAFAQLFAALETAQQIPPVLLQAEHGVPGAAEGGKIGFQQGIVIGLQGSRATPARSQHSGVANQAPAKHDGFHFRVLLRKAPDAVQGAEIAVIAQRDPAGFQSVPQGLLPNRGLVKVLAQPGVED